MFGFSFTLWVVFSNHLCSFPYQHERERPVSAQSDDFVEFFYACGEAEYREEGRTLHHFRSSSLKSEEQYLLECWQECLQREIIIPTHLIRDKDGDGRVIVFIQII